MRTLVLLVTCSLVGCSSPAPAPSQTPPPVHALAPTIPASPLVADLTIDAGLHLEPLAPEYEVWSFQSAVINRGTACATDIGGTITLHASHPIAARAWTLPQTMLPPHGRAEFTGCCFSTAEVQQHGLFFQASFTFRSEPCRGRIE